jgi:hypothetical protein
MGGGGGGCAVRVAAITWACTLRPILSVGTLDGKRLVVSVLGTGKRGPPKWA